MIIEVKYIDEKDILFKDVMKLGNRYRTTLGFMPDGGFLEHAQKRWIIVAHYQKQLMGYLMFRITSKLSRISIVHLCVKDEYRGKQVSSKLLDKLVEVHKTSLTGITLSCRTDYKFANKLWENYGFVCKTKVRSRSIQENYLNKWWYDFNTPNLFSVLDDSSSKIQALLDTNIILKLRDSDTIDEIETSEDPRCLQADWLVDEVDLKYAPEIFNEIARDENSKRAQETRNFLNNFNVALFDIEVFKDIEIALRDEFPRSNENYTSDRKHVATCIAAQIPYLITLDRDILDKREVLESKYNIQAYTPQELVLEIDQLLNQETYSPIKLKGVSSHSVSKVCHNELDPLIEKFKLNKEKRNSFQKIVLATINDLSNSHLKVVKSQDQPVAFYGYESLKNKINISFIRLLDGDIKQTLFTQIIFDFITKSCNQKQNIVELCLKDNNDLSDTQIALLMNMGFTKEINSILWKKVVCNKIIHSSEISDLALSMPISEDNTLVNLELKNFPLKISDLDIPCYIIPIKPYWAGQLFDFNIAGEDLFGADPSRMWNFENVYYRSIKPITEVSPARILWYASTDMKCSRSKAIIASSYLEEVITGNPKELYKTNKHYGIYSWKNIYELCEKNLERPIRALRFNKTEVFKQHIPLQLIREIFISNNRKENTFASPVKVESEIFNQIYKIGSEK